jgi:hypothetical protein
MYNNQIKENIIFELPHKKKEKNNAAEKI